MLLDLNGAVCEVVTGISIGECVRFCAIVRAADHFEQSILYSKRQDIRSSKAQLHLTRFL